MNQSEKKCTKPNCDCAEKEMQKQGTECIKSYPCLNYDTNSDELKKDFKIFKVITNWIEPNGLIG